MRTPRGGCRGTLTLNRVSVGMPRLRISCARTRAKRAAASKQIGVSLPISCEIANDGSDISVASKAADTVPEYVMSSPRL